MSEVSGDTWSPGEAGGRGDEWIPLRRPSDIAAELSAGERRGRGRKRGPDPSDGTPVDAPHLAWPDGFAVEPEDRSALLVLLGLASLTPRRLLELAAERGGAAACLDAVRAGDAGSDADHSHARSIDPVGVAERMAAAGARLVAVGEPEYPPALLDLFDPPAGLFVAGDRLEGLEPSVAIVGARRCSEAGRDLAVSLAGALVRAGLWVVSGGARGIDGAAHRGALDAGGSTVAVLGSGVDVAYPAENRRLFEEIRGRGALVSEYPPGTRAEPFRFPARNRIVAALAQAVVVVEGAEGSGSMITAEHAMEVGRDVFAIPGAVTSPLSFAPHTLIRDGAGLITGPNDLLSDLGLSEPTGPDGAGTGSGSGSNDAVEALGPLERAVWDALVAPAAADVLARTVEQPVSRVMGALVGLEMRSMVRQVGGRYERRPGPWGTRR